LNFDFVISRKTPEILRRAGGFRREEETGPGNKLKTIIYTRFRQKSNYNRIISKKNARRPLFFGSGIEKRLPAWYIIRLHLFNPNRRFPFSFRTETVPTTGETQ
jgi:hypothetical protein